MASANTRLKIENGLVVLSNPASPSEFFGNVEFTANVTVAGNLNVTGTYIVVGATVVQDSEVLSSSIIPAISGDANLGNTTNRWSAYVDDVYITNSILPTQQTSSIGNTTSRFDLFTTNINASGNTVIGGNTTVGTTLYVNNQLKRVGINKQTPDVDLDVVGSVAATGNLHVNGSITIVNPTTSPTSINIGPSNVLHKAVQPFNVLLPKNTTYNHEVIRFNKTKFKGGKIFVVGSITSEGISTSQLSELLLLWNGTDISVVEYGKMISNPGLFSSIFDVQPTVVGENISIVATFKSQTNSAIPIQHDISSNCIGNLINIT